MVRPAHHARRRWIATLGILVAFAAVLVGTWSAFGADGSPSGIDRSRAGAGAAPTLRFTDGAGSLDARDLIPGVAAQQLATLHGARGTHWSGLWLTTVPTTSSLLDADRTHGLRLAIDRCSTPWTAAGERWRCTGSRTTVLASSPLIGARRALVGPLASLEGSGVDHLRVTLLLPRSAGNEFQGLGSRVRFDLTAVERPEGDR